MTNPLKKQLKMSAAGMAIMVGALAPSVAMAAEVTLTSTDGTINVTGEFVEFQDDAFVVRTDLGDLRIAASRVVCQGEACPVFETENADITVAGSAAIGLGMMPLLMTGYAATLDAEAEVNNTAVGQTVATLVSDGGFGEEIGSYLVSSTSDDDAFAALLDGTAKIGMSTRRITRDEARALSADGSGSMVKPEQEHIIAVDSMVVASHASNEVGHLTVDQLRGIFSGQITNWSEVGGADHTINVIMQAEGSASHEYFMSFLFGEERPDFLPQGISADDQTLSNLLYSDKHAIGYLGYAFQRGAKPITLINECGIAAQADAFSAKTEEYLLSRRMYVYNRGDNMDEQSQAFLDFMTSEDADAVISKSGFIDLSIKRRTQSATDGRGMMMSAEAARYDAGFEGAVIREMLNEMEGQDRLSTTLRFRTGSSNIDERGQLDMQRLVTYLENEPAGTNVTLVGFTDDVGAFDANRALSKDRAEHVATELAALAGDRLDHINVGTSGYGPIAPSACNLADNGRAINRRVEVWLTSPVNG